MTHNADCFHFLAGVAAMELQTAYQSLNYGAESLPEFFSLVSSGSVGHKDLGFSSLRCNVINEAWIFNLICKGSYTLMSS